MTEDILKTCLEFSMSFLKEGRSVGSSVALKEKLMKTVKSIALMKSITKPSIILYNKDGHVMYDSQEKRRIIKLSNLQRRLGNVYVEKGKWKSARYYYLASFDLKRNVDEKRAWSVCIDARYCVYHLKKWDEVVELTKEIVSMKTGSNKWEEIVCTLKEHVSDKKLAAVLCENFIDEYGLSYAGRRRSEISEGEDYEFFLVANACTFLLERGNLDSCLTIIEKFVDAQKMFKEGQSRTPVVRTKAILVLHDVLKQLTRVKSIDKKRIAKLIYNASVTFRKNENEDLAKSGYWVFEDKVSTLSQILKLDQG